MESMSRSIAAGNVLKRLVAVLTVITVVATLANFAPAEETKKESLRAKLDSPILFTKRGSYRGIHIYDTCYQWHPGGGIYILENPSDPPEKHRLQVVIDENSTEFTR